MGNRETGGRAALPMWIEFMRAALDGRPENLQEQPEGLVTIRIDAETGKRADVSTRNSLFEVFRVENAPREVTVVKSTANGSGGAIINGDRRRNRRRHFLTCLCLLFVPFATFESYSLSHLCAYKLLRCVRYKSRKRKNPCAQTDKNFSLFVIAVFLRGGQSRFSLLEERKGKRVRKSGPSPRVWPVRFGVRPRFSP
jgi:hypothetical protein